MKSYNIQIVVLSLYLYLANSDAKDQLTMPRIPQQCSIPSLESKKQNLSPQDQDYIKQFKNLVDVSFTKTPLASNNRKQNRIVVLSALITRIMEIANDRALELLKSEYQSTYENIRDRLHAMNKVTPITDQTTQSLMPFIEKQFNKKTSCDDPLMQQEQYQAGGLSKSRMEHYLQEELNVLNDYYTKIHEAIKLLGVKTEFPPKITLYSLKQFAQWDY